MTPPHRLSKLSPLKNSAFYEKGASIRRWGERESGKAERKENTRKRNGGASLMEKRNEISDIVEALYRVKIAIESLNPDPTQTIAEYRKSQKRNTILAIYSTIVSTFAALVAIGSFMFTYVITKTHWWEIVITESFNFAKVAEQNNAENLLIIHDKNWLNDIQSTFGGVCRERAVEGLQGGKGQGEGLWKRYRSINWQKKGL
jgi:hypothetical protein